MEIEEEAPREPISGRVLLKGVSKLSYPAAPPAAASGSSPSEGTESGKKPATLDSRPSAVNWKSWAGGSD